MAVGGAGKWDGEQLGMHERTMGVLDELQHLAARASQLAEVVDHSRLACRR